MSARFIIEIGDERGQNWMRIPECDGEAGEFVDAAARLDEVKAESIAAGESHQFRICEVAS